MNSRFVRSGVADFAASCVSSRNIVRTFPYPLARAMVAVRWRRRLNQGDLSCRLVDHFVGKGSRVIDIGASWGLFSYHLAERIGRRGVLISFEPHPANALGLTKLAKAEPQVRFRNVAVSDGAGTAEMIVPMTRFRSITAQASLAHSFEEIEGIKTELIKVPTVRLDDEVGPEFDPDFIKIDVEGHELSVLRGADATLRRSHPALLIEVEQRHMSEPIEKVFQWLESLGYLVFFVDGSVPRRLDQFDVRRDQLAKITPCKFEPFDMPSGYVNEFLAVRHESCLRGLPLEAR